MTTKHVVLSSTKIELEDGTTQLLLEYVSQNEDGTPILWPTLYEARLEAKHILSDPDLHPDVFIHIFKSDLFRETTSDPLYDLGFTESTTTKQLSFTMSNDTL